MRSAAIRAQGSARGLRPQGKASITMLLQLFIGTVITLISLVGATIIWWIVTEAILRMEPWLAAPPKVAKTFFVVFLVVVSTMVIMTFGVFLWAAMFMQLAVFATWEEAVYYSLVAYTTLGLGDVVIPQDQRLLGGMTGANGFLMFGLMTAMLTDTLRQVGRRQRSGGASTT